TEDRERVIRDEALNVRRNVGLIDVSTLGGLDIRGPDSPELLNRLYTFTYGRQPGGRARYVLMTDQSGAIVDDGVACRLHPEHFYVTATTGVRPFGVEAKRVLRLEKGHIIVGQDSDGLTSPYEADMAWAIGRNKAFFVGSRAIEAQRERGLTRRLVGFTIDDQAAPVPEECHLVVRGAAITGRVTSAVRSPALEKTVGLAYVGLD